MFKRGTKDFEQEVLQAIHSCFAVFTDFLEKLNNCFANLEDNLRNVPERLRTNHNINSGTTAAFSSATVKKPNISLKVSMSVTNILLSITGRS